MLNVIYEWPLSQDLEFAKQQQVAFENSLESEKANALQEMSRGKASALQALKVELNLQHEKDKVEMTEQHAQELSEKLELAEREKQVSIKKTFWLSHSMIYKWYMYYLENKVWVVNFENA